jgi:class 3 adenylate cyclase
MTNKSQPVLNIPKIGVMNAFAFYVDINGFTNMVRAAEEIGDSIAQFTRDCLAGAISEIEKAGGEVVGFMGDAIYGVVVDGDSAVDACWGIAKNIDRQCEYISGVQSEQHDIWDYCNGGPSVKIAIEYGRLDISTIYSRLLGEHPLLIGNAINYAARISKAGKGNRCVLGPLAAQKEFSAYRLKGPQKIRGKGREPVYEYYEFSMADIWIEGPIKKGQDKYWG